MSNIISSELNFTTAGESGSALVSWFAQGLIAALGRHGHKLQEPAASDQHPPVHLVLNLRDIDRPRPIYRRRSCATGSITVSRTVFPS